ncbi:TnsD family Tn7-like transposition protein [Gracilibacillus lacisalsi]|uniref:TnsD family Tn7-like transposition protein n=1 Tax=Gracilibacillus lacisalsi TaxID=393087 RepID=UPI0003A21BC4|nr:TnsD family Tn7-like transposition protein [Gracilibacillus lacisalsi]
MITYLPTLYPGELLYSWFARYHVHSGNLSFKQTTFDLFGSTSHISTPDLPCRLLYLYDQCRHFCPSPPQEWVLKHTFYNYYTTFSTSQIREKVMRCMLEGTNHALHMLTGHMASTVNDIKNFRYCHVCKNEDISSYGEPFLHTIHQLPSCLVCPHHGEILLETSIPFRGFNKHEYRPLLCTDYNSRRIISNINHETFEILFTMAKESQLLIDGNFQFDPEEIQKYYKVLLNRQGLLSPKGNVRQQLLFSRFSHFFNEDTLELLQSAIQLESESNWLKSITRKHRKVFHPTRHLLFMNFVGTSIESLTTTKPIENAFGEGPFPCLNIAANHYKKDIINNVIITHCSKTQKPIGTFTCQCGFIYTRRGPDPNSENRYCISRIKQFGGVWMSKLEVLVSKKEYSLRKIARQLNVDTKTVIKYSKKKRSHSIKSESVSGNTISIIKYRREWLFLQHKNPTLSKTNLRKLNPKLFMWLYRNDKEWLNNHSPKLIELNPPSNKINWSHRDEEIAKIIIPKVIQILNHSKPLRVTRNKIGKLIRKQALLERHLEKLPITNFILAEVTESVEEFQIRRVVWAFNELKDQQEVIKMWELKRFAGLPNRIDLHSKLHDTIERLKTSN